MAIGKGHTYLPQVHNSSPSWTNTGRRPACFLRRVVMRGTGSQNRPLDLPCWQWRDCWSQDPASIAVCGASLHCPLPSCATLHVLPLPSHTSLRIESKFCLWNCCRQELNPSFMPLPSMPSRFAGSGAGCCSFLPSYCSHVENFVRRVMLAKSRCEPLLVKEQTSRT